MTATKSTVYGPYQAYTSDETTATNIYKDLAGALNTENVAPRNVISFDITNKIVVYSRSGRL